MKFRPRATLRELGLIVVIAALLASWRIERRKVAALREAIGWREEINLVPILDPVGGEPGSGAEAWPRRR